MGKVQAIHGTRAPRRCPRTSPLRSLSFGTAEAAAVREVFKADAFKGHVLSKLPKLCYYVSCAIERGSRIYLGSLDTGLSVLPYDLHQSPPKRWLHNDRRKHLGKIKWKLYLRQYFLWDNVLLTFTWLPFDTFLIHMSYVTTWNKSDI